MSQKIKVRVTFDMEFDNGPKSEQKANIAFSLPDYPDTPCPDNVKELIFEEIIMVSKASCALLDHKAKEKS